MASPFETVIGRLSELGGLEFLIFMLTTAIFYGLLRRSQIFGAPEKNVAVNAVVALVAAFLVLAYSILSGVQVTKLFQTFFFNSVVVLLTVVIGIVITGAFFKKSLGEVLEEKFKGGMFVAFVVFGFLLALGVVLSSGLLNVFLPQTTVGIPQDVILTIVVVILLIVTVIGIAALGMGGEEKK